jgi:hypothetical protein
MEEALWNTVDGANLTDGLIPIRIDSTTPEGVALNRKYPVTGLPLALFIDPDGNEIDRVVGYTTNKAFLIEAEPLAAGHDPLPSMEEDLASRPEDLNLMMEVYERYLFRLREGEAESLLTRILELDPQNRSRKSTMALIKMAKHHKIVRNDMEATWEHWKMILDRFPNSTAVSGAINETYRAAISIGKRDEWTEWICAKLDEHPDNARLQFSAAMAARRSHLRGSCWAEAARRAKALGKGNPADLDSLAVVFEGGSATD